MLHNKKRNRNYKIIKEIKLIFTITILQHLSSASWAIIVEKNLHSYYRLPTQVVRTKSNEHDYYVLQCPYKSSVDLPHPKEMSVCMIVGRYMEKNDMPTPMTTKPLNHIPVSVVKYTTVRPTKQMKTTKLQRIPPYPIMLKPMRLIRKPTRNIRFIVPKPLKRPQTIMKQPKPPLDAMASATSTSTTTTTMQSRKVKKKNLNKRKNPKEESETEEVPKSKVPKDDLPEDIVDQEDTEDTQTQKENNQQAEDDFEDIEGDGDGDTDSDTSLRQSPLKYLGAQNIVAHLRQTAPLDVGESRKFWANMKNYKKGFKTKGYQNMYHRDEIFQDHIFYDDLQQNGNYRILKKVKVKN